MKGGGISRWPPFPEFPVAESPPNGIKNSVDTGEALVILDGYQYICFDEFVFNGGETVIDGELIVLEGS